MIKRAKKKVKMLKSKKKKKGHSKTPVHLGIDVTTVVPGGGQDGSSTGTGLNR